MKRLLVILLVSLGMGCLASAKEFPDGSTVSPGSGDWLAADRAAWDFQTTKLDGAELKAWLAANPNSFASAAIDNTKSRKASEYPDVRLRHSYYDYISYYLEHSGDAPVGIRGVRFFHAASSVTVQAELGMVTSFVANNIGILDKLLLSRLHRWVVQRYGLSPETLDLLSAINGDLFTKNMRVIHDLIYDWKFPRDPRASDPRQRMGDLDFDLAMVEFEQSSIQDYIESHSVAESRLDQVNRLLTAGSSINPLSTLRDVRPWLRKAGFSTDDFKKYAWRVATGRALVFRFHKKDEAEYVEFMKAHPPERKSRAYVYSGIQAPATSTRSARGAFTVVGSWRTQAGALRHLSELRRQNLGLQPAVYPPYGRDNHWTVVVSSYVDEMTASELRKRSRAAGVARDSFVLNRRAVDRLGRAFIPHLSETELSAAPDLMRAAATDVVSAGKGALVTVFRDADLVRVQARRKELLERFPGLRVGTFKLKDENVYALTLASFADQKEAQQALAMARRLSIPSQDVLVSTIARSDILERLDGVPGLQTTWNVINSCYSSGKTTVGALKECSGYWLTPSTLTRCILNSDCRAIEAERLPAAAQVDDFLQSNGLTVNTGLKLVAASVPLPPDAQQLVSLIQNCRNEAQGDNARFVACYSKGIDPKIGAVASDCVVASSQVTDMASCIAAKSGDPRLAKVAQCVTGDLADTGQAALCLLGPERAGEVRKVSRCIEGTRSPQGLLAECSGLLLPPEQQRKVECISAAHGDARQIALCALPATPGTRAAIAAFDCASKEGVSAKDAAACLSGLVGGEAGRAAACLKETQSNAALAGCMLRDRPELASAEKAFRCATGGTDTASLIANCSEGILNDDARQVAGCIARNGADREAIARCAAGTLLPKELGPVTQCAASSTGGVDFALCMAGPSMNAEWRIAAECAVSSGGEPISFTSCTAGRLTIRELTKCLTGTFGKDCFGEGNTIVAAYTTVGKDLTNCLSGKPCLGENNDIVKTAKAVEAGVAHLGKEAEKVWHSWFGKESDFCRGDLFGWICRL